MTKPTEDSGIKIISRNRRAHQKFTILESLEAGLMLYGYEVKSLRQGRISIDESFVDSDKGEMFLNNAHIPPYEHISHIDYNPTRKRKLLLHRKEIDRLFSRMQTERVSLIPLELYFKKGMAKVSIGLGKGKKTEDRREELKKRDTDRDIRRNLGGRR